MTYAAAPELLPPISIPKASLEVPANITLRLCPGGTVLLYDERSLKAPVARLQCAENAFVLDLQWRPPPEPPRASGSVAHGAGSAADAASAAIPAEQQQQQQQQQQQPVPGPVSRPASLPSSPSRSSSGRSRFADENSLQPPTGAVTSGKPGAAPQPQRPRVDVPPAPERPPSAFGSPPRSPRATLRQLLDGGSPVRDPAAAAAIAAAAAETQRQVWRASCA